MYTLPGGQSPDGGRLSGCLLRQGHGAECCEDYQQALTAAARPEQWGASKNLLPLLEDHLCIPYNVRVRQCGTMFASGNKIVADRGG